MVIKNWIDVEVTNEEVIIHGTARLMNDGNYYLDARVGGDVILNGVKYEIDQVVEVKLSVNKEAMEAAESGILDRGQKIEKVFRLKAVEHTLAGGQDERYCPGHAAPVVNGECFDCGLPRRPAAKA